jgi:LPXTG-site transpeptidase (sortase) family protein
MVAVVVLAVGLSLALSGAPGTTAPSSTAPSSTAPGETGSATPTLGAVAATSPLPTFPPISIVPLPTFPPVSVAPSPTPAPTAVPTEPGAEPGIRANRIQVPSVSIDLPVVQGDGVDAPLGKATHYPGTGWPGGGTNVYLYGHARQGMFIGLWDVKVGAQVVVHLVDGTQRLYEVTSVLPRVPWNALQYVNPTPTEQLTLQTCTSYQNTAPRFIVIAEPSQ